MSFLSEVATEGITQAAKLLERTPLERVSMAEVAEIFNSALEREQELKILSSGVLGRQIADEVVSVASRPIDEIFRAAATVEEVEQIQVAGAAAAKGALVALKAEYTPLVAQYADRVNGVVNVLARLPEEISVATPEAVKVFLQRARGLEGMATLTDPEAFEQLRAVISEADQAFASRADVYNQYRELLAQMFDNRRRYSDVLRQYAEAAAPYRAALERFETRLKMLNSVGVEEMFSSRLPGESAASLKRMLEDTDGDVVLENGYRVTRAWYAKTYLRGLDAVVEAKTRVARDLLAVGTAETPALSGTFPRETLDAFLRASAYVDELGRPESLVNELVDAALKHPRADELVLKVPRVREHVAEARLSAALRELDSVAFGEAAANPVAHVRQVAAAEAAHGLETTYSPDEMLQGVLEVTGGVVAEFEHALPAETARAVSAFYDTANYGGEASRKAIEYAIEFQKVAHFGTFGKLQQLRPDLLVPMIRAGEITIALDEAGEVTHAVNPLAEWASGLIGEDVTKLSDDELREALSSALEHIRVTSRDWQEAYSKFLSPQVLAVGAEQHVPKRFAVRDLARELGVDPDKFEKARVAGRVLTAAIRDVSHEMSRGLTKAAETGDTELLRNATRKFSKLLTVQANVLSESNLSSKVTGEGSLSEFVQTLEKTLNEDLADFREAVELHHAHEVAVGQGITLRSGKTITRPLLVREAFEAPMSGYPSYGHWVVDQIRQTGADVLVLDVPLTPPDLARWAIFLAEPQALSRLERGQELIQRIGERTTRVSALEKRLAELEKAAQRTAERVKSTVPGSELHGKLNSHLLYLAQKQAKVREELEAARRVAGGSKAALTRLKKTETVRTLLEGEQATPGSLRNLVKNLKSGRSGADKLPLMTTKGKHVAVGSRAGWTLENIFDHLGEKLAKNVDPTKALGPELVGPRAPLLKKLLVVRTTTARGGVVHGIFPDVNGALAFAYRTTKEIPHPRETLLQRVLQDTFNELKKRAGEGAASPEKIDRLVAKVARNAKRALKRSAARDLLAKLTAGGTPMDDLTAELQEAFGPARGRGFMVEGAEEAAETGTGSADVLSVSFGPGSGTVQGDAVTRALVERFERLFDGLHQVNETEFSRSVRTFVKDMFSEPESVQKFFVECDLGAALGTLE